LVWIGQWLFFIIIASIIIASASYDNVIVVGIVVCGCLIVTDSDGV
jgi:hypothetical protein